MPRDNCTDEKFSDPSDPNPVELAIGRDKDITFKDEIMEQVRAMLAAEKKEIYETIEDFTDFEMEDDPDPIASAYEVQEMQEEFIEYEPAPEPVAPATQAPEAPVTEPQAAGEAAEVVSPLPGAGAE